MSAKHERRYMCVSATDRAGFYVGWSNEDGSISMDLSFAYRTKTQARSEAKRRNEQQQSPAARAGNKEEA